MKFFGCLGYKNGLISSIRTKTVLYTKQFSDFLPKKESVVAGDFFGKEYSSNFLLVDGNTFFHRFPVKNIFHIKSMGLSQLATTNNACKGIFAFLHYRSSYN